MDVFLHGASKIVAPKLVSFTTPVPEPKSEQAIFGWIKWKCPGKNSDWLSFGHGISTQPISVMREWEVFDCPGWVTWPFLFVVGDKWSHLHLKDLEADSIC